MTGTLYAGTSGFAYKEWKGGVFYPEGTKDREMLAYYASVLGSVEINYTFRRQASEKTLTTWRDATAAPFRFTLKANQRITHWLRLQHADEAVLPVDLGANSVNFYGVPYTGANQLFVSSNGIISFGTARLMDGEEDRILRRILQGDTQIVSYPGTSQYAKS